MQLADDHSLRSVNDERAVICHQGDIAEEDFLLLDVPHGFRARFRILVINRQAHGDFQRRGISHPAFLALSHVIFQLQGDWIPAFVAERGSISVQRAAAFAHHVARLVGIGYY